MSAASDSPRLTTTANIIIWVATLVVAGFYLLPTVGWVSATVMALDGVFGEAGIAAMADLGPIDHLMRGVQVVAICIASVLLILGRKPAYFVFAAALGFSLVVALSGLRWGVSYLGLVPTTISLAFSWLLVRQGVLR